MNGLGWINEEFSIMDTILSMGPIQLMLQSQQKTQFQIFY